jgi:hypothetical protein
MGEEFDKKRMHNLHLSTPNAIATVDRCHNMRTLRWSNQNHKYQQVQANTSKHIHHPKATTRLTMKSLLQLLLTLGLLAVVPGAQAGERSEGRP